MFCGTCSRFFAVALFVVSAHALTSMAADDAKQATTQYYLGESKMTTEEGAPLRTSLSLVKRVVNAKENQIEEHVLSVSEKESRAFVVTLQVKGSTFTLNDKTGALTGDGELFGEPWNWNKWRSTTKLPGGTGTVTSEDELSEKVLIANKTYVGPDGKTTLRFRDTLSPISQKTYEILYARLAPADPK